MKIFNGTYHDVNIYSMEDVVSVDNRRLYLRNSDIKPVITISKDKPLNAITKYEKYDSVNGVDLYKMKIVSCDEIPDADIVIVSALFASACEKLGKNVDNLFTVSQPVFESESNPRPIGCIGLNKYK